MEKSNRLCRRWKKAGGIGICLRFRHASLQKYGSTYREVQKDGYKNTYVAFEQVMTDNMSYNLGVVLMNLARYADQIKPDMIVVHGDRIDALAGAITGALNNIWWHTSRRRDFRHD